MVYEQMTKKTIINKAFWFGWHAAFEVSKKMPARESDIEKVAAQELLRVYKLLE